MNEPKRIHPIGAWLRKYILPVYWITIVFNCIFLYFELPYVALTSSLPVPLLLCYLLLKDPHISFPTGKFVFYIGLLFAFFGDVLQIVVNNELFFTISLVAFMLMNTCYSISFYNLNRGGLKKPLAFLAAIVVLAVLGYAFVRLLEEEIGAYKVPLILYMSTLITMTAFVIHAARSEQYYQIAVKYLLPGTIIFIIQNIIFALNLFHLGGPSNGFIYSIIPYAIAQFLMVKGMEKAYL